MRIIWIVVFGILAYIVLINFVAPILVEKGAYIGTNLSLAILFVPISILLIFNRSLVLHSSYLKPFLAGIVTFYVVGLILRLIPGLYNPEIFSLGILFPSLFISLIVAFIVNQNFNKSK